MAAALPNPTSCCQVCDDSTTVITDTIGWLIAQNLTYARAYPASTFNKFLVLEGLDTPGDGYGGTYFWSATSTAADDGSTVINPTGNTGAGRWIKLL